MIGKLLALISLLALFPLQALGQIPDAAIPNGLGVNIHFTDEQPGEVEQIAAMGVKLIRMDFDWIAVEKEPGEYTFDAYDRLMTSLERHKLRPIFILDYVHPHHDDSRSPDTDAGRAAFARFAAAAAKHFRGRGVIWEIYNEPNIFPFWRPKPNVQDYIKLATATAEAIRAADPQATIIGPACSGIDFDFLEACLNAGMLNHFTGVSVHPYRQRDPETAAGEYRRLRTLLTRERQGESANAHPRTPSASLSTPVISGEWGYSDIWAGYDRQQQATMLARQWLFNLSQGIPISIWYDWRDDGTKPDDAEHHFGTVEHALEPLSGTPPFKPKPAYIAGQTLIGQLRGMKFCKRLWTGLEQDWVLLFADNAGNACIAAWTTSTYDRDLVIPTGDGVFTQTGMLGGVQEASLKAYQGRVPVKLTREPTYIRTQAPASALRLAAGWSVPPLEIPVTLEGSTGKAKWVAKVTNPLGETAGVLVGDKPPPANNDGVESIHKRIGPGESTEFAMEFPVARTTGPQHAEVYLSVEGVPDPFVQQVTFVCTNPIEVLLQPVTRNDIMLSVRAPAGDAFTGSLQLLSEYLPGDGSQTVDVNLPAGGKAFTRLVKIDDSRPNPSELSATLAAGGPPAAAIAYTDLWFNKDTWQTAVEGDEKVPATHALEFIETAELGAKTKAAKIDYRFDAGWRFVMLQQKQPIGSAISNAATLGLWVKGDGSGNVLRCRFVDAVGQTFQPDGPRLNFTDWRYVEFPLDGTDAGHWGGDKSGRVNYPITIETLLLIDSATRQKSGGNVMVAAPMVIRKR